MTTIPTLYITHRGERHQQAALKHAPKELQITMLRSPGKTEVLQHLPGVQFLISERKGVIDADIIQAGKDLKLIQRLGTQTWDIDHKTAELAGIPVCFWPIPSSIAVAEHVIMLTLGLLKQLDSSRAAMRSVRWEQEPQRSGEDTYSYNWTNRTQVLSLRHRKFGILGFGEIGVELARRLKGFESEIQYFKRKRYPLMAETDLGIYFSKMDEIIRSCDVVCSLLPFSDSTNQVIDQSWFGNMKPGAFFIHCGGSGVVNEDALQSSLLEGKLGGAALDTYTWEPLPINHPLLAMSQYPQYNLLLTPHIGSGADRFMPNERGEEYTNIVRILQGKKPFHQLVQQKQHCLRQ